MKQQQQVTIISVWSHNLVSEFDVIDSVIDRYPYIAIDTEFPGTLYDSSKPHYLRTPEEQYALVKKNVDELHLIQLGLTLSDADGNLPDLGTGGATRFTWEFNFRDFDILNDSCVPKSVSLLIKNGIDFGRTRSDGIDSSCFAKVFMTSRIASSPLRNWITFHGAYDFAYLMKIITGRKLPSSLEEFLSQVRRIFGTVYDIKSMILYCNGLFGGLDQVARLLQVERSAGRSHQAGSDSLLTGLTFPKVRDLYAANRQGAESLAGVLYGLQCH